MGMKGNLERLRRLAAVLALVAVLALPAGVAAEDFLTLEESIELALRQSVLIHAAEEGVRAAEALKKEAFNLRFRQATGELENTARMRAVRRDVARIRTVLNQKAAEAAAK